MPADGVINLKSYIIVLRNRSNMHSSCLRVKKSVRRRQSANRYQRQRVLAVAAVVEMPSHGPGLRSFLLFFFFHRRYCTSIFIPPHVPARRPARGGREKMQPPNTIDRYKHTRAAYHGRVLLRVQRFARAPDRNARKVTEREYRQKENRKRNSDGSHRKKERGREEEKGKEERGTQRVTRAFPSMQHARTSSAAAPRRRWDVAPADYVVSELF